MILRPSLALAPLVALALVASATPASPCSVFVFSADETVAVGANLDLEEELEGLVIVNVRGVEKSVLPWQGRWPARFEGEETVWVSTYGSVTFTCYGRDFIEGGMNEAGLVIDQATLGAVYPPGDARPGVSCSQWMQYQLDNFATVEEVIGHLDTLRQDGEGWHYLVADAAGACAVIEYLDGAPTVYAGDRAPYCMITNAPYADVLEQLPLDVAFGGPADIGSGDDSYGRFARIAARLRDNGPTSGRTPEDFIFTILDDVSGEDTQRTVVYDAGSGRVTWTSWRSEERRWLQFSDLDMSEGSPTLVAYVHEGAAGDAAPSLVEYTLGANRASVAASMAPAFYEGSVEILAQRGFTPEAVVELIAAHPTSR